MNADSASTPARTDSAADYDQSYAWGRTPSTYLAPRQVVRLTILRSHLGESNLRNRVVELH